MNKRGLILIWIRCFHSCSTQLPTLPLLSSSVLKKQYNKHILLFLCLEVAVCTFLVVDIFCKIRRRDKTRWKRYTRHWTKASNCHSFAIWLLWVLTTVLTTWVFIIQNMWVNQTFWIRPNCTFIFLFVFRHISLLSVWGPLCMNKVWTREARYWYE